MENLHDGKQLSKILLKQWIYQESQNALSDFRRLYTILVRKRHFHYHCIAPETRHYYKEALLHARLKESHTLSD